MCVANSKFVLLHLQLRRAWGGKDCGYREGCQCSSGACRSSDAGRCCEQGDTRAMAYGAGQARDYQGYIHEGAAGVPQEGPEDWICWPCLHEFLQMLVNVERLIVWRQQDKRLCDVRSRQDLD